MEQVDLFGVRVSKEGSSPPTAANENDHLKPDWMTPAELMQWVRQRKERLTWRLANDSGLWTCPEHRRAWNATLGIEQVARRQYYGIMDA